MIGHGIFSALGSLLTWLTVILGWMVVADQANFREIRKDRAARLNEIRKTLTDIEGEAVDFHTAAAFEKAKFLSLTRRLGTMSRELSLLWNCGFLMEDPADLVIQFKQACTSENADASTFKEQDHYGALVGYMMVAKEDLDDMLVESLTIALTNNKAVTDSIHSVFRQSRHKIGGLWSDGLDRIGERLQRRK